jgi:hypothetical protein
LILVAAAKNHNARKSRHCPDVAFYGLHTAGPEPFWSRSDQSATISNLSDHGFESLITRLLPLDQNKKLN